MGWFNTDAAAATPIVEALDARGVTCSRAASVMATVTLQQGARSSAVALSSPALAQHEDEESHQSAARAGRTAEPITTLTAIAAPTRRIGRILLGFPFRDNSNVWSMRTPDLSPVATEGLHSPVQ
jgi:hypothetical protein